MDGIETLRRMKQMEENLCKNTPVIALTANAIVGVKEMYLAEGFDAYLSKPITGEKLEEVLIEYLPKDKLILGAANVPDASEELAVTEEPEEERGMIDTAVGLRYSADSKEMYHEF